MEAAVFLLQLQSEGALGMVSRLEIALCKKNTGLIIY